jgi:hypothetical protein
MIGLIHWADGVASFRRRIQRNSLLQSPYRISLRDLFYLPDLPTGEVPLRPYSLLISTCV